MAWGRYKTFFIIGRDASASNRTGTFVERTTGSGTMRVMDQRVFSGAVSRADRKLEQVMRELRSEAAAARFVSSKEDIAKVK